MAYNLTGLNAANTTLEYVTEVNTLTDDWLIRLFLIGLFSVIVITTLLRTGRALGAAVAASFVTTIVTFLFYGANLTGTIEPLISLLSLVVFTLILYLGGTPE